MVAGRSPRQETYLHVTDSNVLGCLSIKASAALTANTGTCGDVAGGCAVVSEEWRWLAGYRECAEACSMESHHGEAGSDIGKGCSHAVATVTQ